MVNDFYKKARSIRDNHHHINIQVYFINFIALKFELVMKLNELRDRTTKNKKKIVDLEQQFQDPKDKVGTSNIDQTEVIKRDFQIADLEKMVAALKDQNTQLDAANKDIKKQLKTLRRLRIINHRLRHLKHKRRRL
ncbi:hypothetical protein EIN_119640 [Entamoeba invadens IP1]|uniref:Uncharacterized protein n=1 Tax=Entamoeba invadens IP1 TaxID=370355 RepID=L7FQ10_ENTIV|nr:hypothetical protein EIN_119640 [Entamoeba invadens IP1]ELP92290.1 hypothetical protein EIN_119640 [Entamoeba invadens IP1]|eukprot:XP_004259061.1 hypothetical protein EIN_119640 [Entamoeba invadens IP1]